MKFDAIFFIGPQGSGKGTQAKILAQRFGFFYWEMGGILREVAQQDTDFGHKVAELINSGVLLTDDILLEVVRNKIGQLPPGQALIFDGIPRRIGQAEFLLDHLKEKGYKDFVTLFIDLPHDESINRLLLRAEKEGRKDDTRERIEFRLKQYQEDTLPVLDYLKNQGQFFTIDGRPPVEEVTKSINQALGVND